MSVSSIPARRLLITIGVIGALVLGYGSIRAAAAWTAASAPLTVAPVTVSSLEDRLATEQARSDALLAQLEALSSQSTDLTAALEAAQARIAADTDHATGLTKDLKTAKKQLAKLQATIRRTQAAAARQAAVALATANKAAKASSSSSGHEAEHEDDEEEDDGTDPRRPVHLAVLVGVSASAYAISLAGVAMLQSTADRALIEDRTPVDAAARGLDSAHDALDQVVDDAARAYGASADRYTRLSDQLTDMEGRLDELSTSVATVAGAADALPTRISLPKVSVSVPRVAKPATHATTGASG